MKLSELEFSYPPELVATEPVRPSRVLYSEGGGAPQELSLVELLGRIPPGDVLVVNDTKVLPMRVWSLGGDEVLFVHQRDDVTWDVLFPARDHGIGGQLQFPDGVEATLVAKGLPQRLTFQQPLSSQFFAQHGEPALPPYIQAARGERHARPADREWYQTAWAKHDGSTAAPTASLHFSNVDIDGLRARGVLVETLTLHVGPGTFLPIKEAELEKHVMHKEQVFLSSQTVEALKKAKHDGRRVWALGTTVTRALESWANGRFDQNEQGFFGWTDLFIRPGYEFKVVDRLLTNFHQPRSTLLALVMAFGGQEPVREAYQWAIDRRFRLFSYGDLSAWIR